MRLDAAVDADAVLEVDDVVAGLERRDRLERRPGRVATRAAQPAFAPEDLVVGEHAEARGQIERRGGPHGSRVLADLVRTLAATGGITKPPFSTPIASAAGTGTSASSFSSSSSRSPCPALSHRMIVGVPSRTMRRSRRMSRSIGSGGRTGKTIGLRVARRVHDGDASRRRCSDRERSRRAGRRVRRATARLRRDAAPAPGGAGPRPTCDAVRAPGATRQAARPRVSGGKSSHDRSAAPSPASSDGSRVDRQHERHLGAAASIAA